MCVRAWIVWKWVGGGQWGEVRVKWMSWGAGRNHLKTAAMGCCLFFSFGLSALHQ
jgi:hypothetical protein